MLLTLVPKNTHTNVMSLVFDRLILQVPKCDVLKIYWAHCYILLAYVQYHHYLLFVWPRNISDCLHQIICIDSYFHIFTISNIYLHIQDTCKHTMIRIMAGFYYSLEHSNSNCSDRSVRINACYLSIIESVISNINKKPDSDLVLSYMLKIFTTVDGFFAHNR